MNKLQIFKYQTHEVRTIQKDGETWFVLKDVCQILRMDTTQLKKVADRLEEDERGRNLIPTPGGEQESCIINESGLYNVILRSDKPEAKPFRKWRTKESANHRPLAMSSKIRISTLTGPLSMDTK